MTNKIKNLIIAGISMISGMLFQYLFGFLDGQEVFLCIVLLLLLLIALLLTLFMQTDIQKHKVRYAVLVFVINPQQQLLTRYSSFHKRFIIPGGIIHPSLSPNKAASDFLKKQTGIYVDAASICPTNAQIEFITKHERFVKEHYAFVYFFHLTDSGILLSGDAQFRSFNDLKELPTDKKLFNDLFIRYCHHICLAED